MTQLTDFGKSVKHRLIDMEKTQAWLFQEIEKETGLKVDSSYWARIASGKRNPTKVIQAVCQILDLSMPDNFPDKKD